MGDRHPHSHPGGHFPGVFVDRSLWSHVSSLWSVKGWGLGLTGHEDWDYLPTMLAVDPKVGIESEDGQVVMQFGGTHNTRIRKGSWNAGVLSHEFGHFCKVLGEMKSQIKVPISDEFQEFLLGRWIPA